MFLFDIMTSLIACAIVGILGLLSWSAVSNLKEMDAPWFVVAPVGVICVAISTVVVLTVVAIVVTIRITLFGEFV